MNRRSLLGYSVGTALLLTPLLIYGIPLIGRPPATEMSQTLFQGITYQRSIRTTPRPIVIHTTTIDLTAPGIEPLVTPGQKMNDDREITARTTSAFLSEFQVQLAVNGNFFFPFREESPWDYYPRTGDRVSVVGTAISNGDRYSEPEKGWPALCFLGAKSQRRATIAESGTCPPNTAQAIAGRELLVKNGKPAAVDPSGDQKKAYPRVVAALNRSGTMLWLIVVDGKQRLYSEGMTIDEVTEFLMPLGVETAVNLDGGGSATLVTGTPSGPQLLNAPIQNKLPMQERPIANHLGFYARPSTASEPPNES